MAEVVDIINEAAGHQRAGRYAEAVAGYRQLLQVDPYRADVYVNIAIALRAQGRPGEAVACYKQAIQLKPEFIEAYYNLANVLKDQGRFTEAIENYSKAVGLKPDFHQAFYNLANALRSCGRLEEAIENYNRAVRLKSDYPAAHVNLAMSLRDIGRTAEAVDNYKRAIRLKPDYPQAHNNLGIALKELGRLDEAVESYAEAIRLRPDYAEAHNNMGIALHARGEHGEALESCERAIELKPEYAEAHWNRSLVLLLKGRFEEGWDEYRWRRKTHLTAFAYSHEFDRPLWDGKPFVGKRLLVHYEQGLGDNLQFVRYLPMVKRLGGTVIFETPKPMYRLLESFNGIDELVEALPDAPPDVQFDACASLMDLPGIFGTTLESIPAEVPYIHADPEQVERWREQIAGDDFKVGLVWAGRPTGRNEVLSLQHRSCSLEHFAPLAGIAGVELYGLQKGPAAAQVGQFSGQIAVGNLGEQFEDFADTAAAVENMDLVISIDTSVAHLAGAMGKPVWVL
ncbi:MAG: glycosyltransferase family protein, partial [Phycisphaerales bacterium]